jgi:hypothetical protein
MCNVTVPQLAQGASIRHRPGRTGVHPSPDSYKPRARARGLREQRPPRRPCRPGESCCPVSSDARRRSAWPRQLVCHVTVPQLAQGAFIRHRPGRTGVHSSPDAYKPRARARGLREQRPPRRPCRPGESCRPVSSDTRRRSAWPRQLVCNVTVPQLAQGAFIRHGLGRTGVRSSPDAYKPRARARGLREQRPPRRPCHPASHATRFPRTHDTVQLGLVSWCATSQSPSSRRGLLFGTGRAEQECTLPLTHTSPGREPGDCGEKGHPADHATRPRRLRFAASTLRGRLRASPRPARGCSSG